MPNGKRLTVRVALALLVGACRGTQGALLGLRSAWLQVRVRPLVERERRAAELEDDVGHLALLAEEDLAAAVALQSRGVAGSTQ